MRNGLLEKLEIFAGERLINTQRQSRHVPAWAGEALGEPRRYGIADIRDDDGNGAAGIFRRDGAWGIACRICLRDWGMLDEPPDMEDLSSFTSTRALLSEQMRAFMNAGVGPKRDRTDPSYQRPLRVDPERVRAYKQMVRGKTG